MKRVVITGMGLVSSIGNDLETVTDALWKGRSGITADDSFKSVGMRSQISGSLQFDAQEIIPKKQLRFMSRAGAYAWGAADQAISMSGVTASTLSSGRAGMIVGTGGVAYDEAIDAVEILKSSGIRKVGPYRVTRGMASSVTACLATAFGIRGVSYAVSSACASGAHAIGVASEQIRLGNQDLMVAGGADDPDWTMAVQFDAMGALSTKFNHSPTEASRPYDRSRDGFVISGGAGVVVLESLEHARERGATIIAELVGYGVSSDGVGMVVPSGEGAERCMRMAANGHAIDYINTHGTSTPAGDLVELNAISKVMGSHLPLISSTKSITGHGLGAAGAQEAIYSLLMLQNGFVAGSQNILDLDPDVDSEIAGKMICRESRRIPLSCVMTNSFGFGGTNAALTFKKSQSE